MSVDKKLPGSIPLIEMTASEIVTRTRAGELSASEIADAVIARVEDRAGSIRAYSFFDAELLRERAADLDRTESRGALHGVPVAIKDVVNTKDMPTQHNSPRYAGSRPAIDAACVDILRGAGALFTGKTVTTPFAASSRPGPTRNPLDLSRTPGGSSSGSAAAVADFQSALAVGTQTGGSTIRPASFTGVFAWKPTWSSVSREGLKLYSATCDTVGLFARSVEDLELLADVFDIESPESRVPQHLGEVRVGVCRTPAWWRAQPATRDAMAAGVAKLETMGAEVVGVELPGDFDGIDGAYQTIVDVEGHAALLNEVRATADVDDSIRQLVQRRSLHTVADCRSAYGLADRCRSVFDDIASEFDVVLTPSATGEAPVGLDSTGDFRLNNMWTLLQVPVVNVPGQVGPAGMPVGLSLVGRRYDDRRVMGVARLAGEAWTSGAVE